MAFTINDITDGVAYPENNLLFIDFIINDYLGDKPYLKNKIDDVITQRGGRRINPSQDIVSWVYDGETLYGFKNIEDNQQEIAKAKDNLVKLISVYEEELTAPAPTQPQQTPGKVFAINQDSGNKYETETDQQLGVIIDGSPVQSIDGKNQYYRQEDAGFVAELPAESPVLDLEAVADLAHQRLVKLNKQGKYHTTATFAQFTKTRNSIIGYDYISVGNSPVFILEIDDSGEVKIIEQSRWGEEPKIDKDGELYYATHAFDYQSSFNGRDNKAGSLVLDKNKRYIALLATDGSLEGLEKDITYKGKVATTFDPNALKAKLERIIAGDKNFSADNLLASLNSYSYDYADNRTAIAIDLTAMVDGQNIVACVADGMGGESSPLEDGRFTSQVASQTCTQTLEAEVAKAIENQKTTSTPTPPPVAGTVAEKEKEDNVRADLSTNPDDYTLKDSTCGYNDNPIGESFCDACGAELHETAEAILYKGERIKYSELPDAIKQLITDERMREKLERLERENDSTSTPVLPKEGDGEDKKLDTDTPENLTTPTPQPAPNLDEPDTTTDKTFKQLADKFVNSLDEKDYEAVANAGRQMQVFDKLSDGTVIYIEPESDIEKSKDFLKNGGSIDDFVKHCNIAIKTTDGNWLYTSNINEGIVFANSNTTNITGAGYDINGEKKAKGDMQENNMQKGDQQIIDILEGLYKVPSPTINAPPVLGIGR